MRRITVVSMISFMVALMTMQPVSAELLVVEVPDAERDLPFFWDPETGDQFYPPTNGNQKWCDYEYLDMISYRLSKDTDTGMFKFELTVAGDFPEPGDALYNGVQRIDWMIWFDREPSNWALASEVTTEYILNLTFDGTRYSCSICDYYMMYGDVVAELTPSIDGATFSTSFSGDVIGDISDDVGVEFYWIVTVRVIHGKYSCNWADYTDFNVAPGQVWNSIPWPSPVEP